MRRFFVPSSAVGETAIAIEGGDARHIAGPLRMACGDAIVICDYAGKEYHCKIRSITPERVLAEIGEIRINDTEPPFQVHLYQAMPKGEKFDVIVQKAVECGVASITPFLSSRCIARPTEKDVQKRLLRWQKISQEAAKQCGRGKVPEIHPLCTLEEAIERAGRSPLALLCYEGDGTKPLGCLLPPDPPAEISFLIGSEGGFDQAEGDLACAAGLLPCGLGKRILRTETASSFLLACLVMRYELSGNV